MITTKREKAIKILLERVTQAKQEHIADLMRANRVEELEELVKEFDMSDFDDNVESIGRLQLKLAEIPEDSLLELVFVLNSSNSWGHQIWDNWEEFTAALRESGQPLEIQIADLMEDCNLSEYTLEELLSGKHSEEDDDDWDDEPEE